EPSLPGAHPRVDREQRHEVDVGPREPPEELPARVPHVRREMDVEPEMAGPLLEHPPLVRLEEVAGQMPAANEPPRLAGREPRAHDLGRRFLQHASSTRSRCLRTLPVSVRGNSATKWKRLGTL